MKQYMLSVHHDSKDAFEGRDLTPDDFQRMFEQVDAFNQDVTAKGAWVFGGGLVPASSATVVRPGTDGDVSITDGPYAEAKEMMGGFWVIEAPDHDTALELATAASKACNRRLELRPFLG